MSFVESLVLFSVGQPCRLPDVTRKICSQLSPTSVSQRSLVPGRIRRPNGFRKPFANAHLMFGSVCDGSLNQGLSLGGEPGLARFTRMILEPSDVHSVDVPWPPSLAS